MSLYKGSTAIAGIPTGLIDTVNNKANTDLDNLSDTGKTVIDGQWVYKELILADGVSWTASATYDLTEYLPKDENLYEVLFTGVATATTTAKKFVSIALSTDIVTSNINVCQGRCAVNSIVGEGTGSVILPVGTGRTVTQYMSTSSNAGGSYDLFAKAYRRVGTNS